MRTERKTTLSDVARRAGVSATTASYILNGRSSEMRIALETQQRVRQAAEDLRYRPNPSARNLRGSTTRTIGVISDLVAGGTFASQMLTGASAAARLLQHVIVIGESQDDPELETLLIEEMLDRHVDGIVYAKLVTDEVSVPPQLLSQRAVLLNCVDRSSALPAVVPDEYQGGRTAAEEILAGTRGAGIWLVGGRPTSGGIAGDLRLDGIRDRLRSEGIALAGILPCDWAVADAFAAFSGFLAQGGRPSSVICLNDRIAMGVYQALGERGLAVPGDVSIVSFDGSELARWLRPELTSVVLPYAELGARAVEMLFDPLSGRGQVLRVPMPVSRGGSVRTAGV